MPAPEPRPDAPSRAGSARKRLNRSISAAEWRAVAGPTAFFLLAVALLIYDHVEGRLGAVLFWIGLALVAAAFARMLDTIGKNHRDAFRDELTGLENGIKLDEDLSGALAEPGEGRRQALILLEVEGVDTYSNRFGPARTDRLISDVGERLGETSGQLGGSAYRLEGAQFAALVPDAAAGSGEILARSAGSFGSDDEDELSSPYGEIVLPDDAATAETALQLAGQRLHARKQRQRRSARRQAHAALKAVLDARRPELRGHLRAVAPRAINLGRRLGLGREQLDDVVQAASLQDIGLLTVPEQILEKQGRLDERELGLIRKHPLAGARIIAAAPALAAVAELVETSYERFDGSGYPKGLTGEDIPLGARIIAVCVAAAAMGSPRPNRPALAQDEVLAELRRCAGSQFDPQVVDAFAAELDEESALLGTKRSSSGAPAPA